MQRYSIVLRPAGQKDLVDIATYVGEHSPAAAERLLVRISDRIQQLASFPQLGPLRPEIARDARVLTVGSYYVLYRIADENIEVVRVIHAARDLPLDD